MKKLIKKILPFIICFYISFKIVNISPNISNSLLISDDFLLRFLGNFLAFSIATIAFLFTSSDKIRESLIKTNQSNEIIDKIQNNICNLFNELKKDIFAIFYFCIIIIILIIISNIDIRYPSYFAINKELLINSCKLTLVILTFLLIFDILYSLFGIVNAVMDLPKNKL